MANWLGTGMLGTPVATVFLLLRVVLALRPFPDVLTTDTALGALAVRGRPWAWVVCLVLVVAGSADGGAVDGGGNGGREIEPAIPIPLIPDSKPRPTGLTGLSRGVAEEEGEEEERVKSALIGTLW